jgi:hypothetical protein
VRCAAGTLFSALIALVGCDRDPIVRLNDAEGRHSPRSHVNSVYVHVLAADGRDCMVNSQRMRCNAVGAYLKDDLHVGLSEAVTVGPDATGRAAVAGAESVRTRIRAAGYSDVWIVGFLTSPDHPNPDP